MSDSFEVPIPDRHTVEMIKEISRHRVATMVMFRHAEIQCNVSPPGPKVGFEVVAPHPFLCRIDSSPEDAGTRLRGSRRFSLSLVQSTMP